MKTRILQILGVAAIATLGMVSCDTDACKDVTCENGGACVEGDCECPDGFGGADCATDFCADVSCTTGGTLTGTTTGCDCVCLEYYMGDSCQATFSSKYVTSPTAGGTEDVINGAQPPITYTVEIIVDGVDKIVIKNLGGYTTSANVAASIDASDYEAFSFTGFVDATGRSFTGTGSLNAVGTEVTVNYVVTYTDSTTETGVATITL